MFCAVAACDGAHALPLDASRAPDAWGGPCNLVTQQGCGSEDKCTWIATTPATTACRTAGSASLGMHCRFSGTGLARSDDCVAGAWCEVYTGLVCRRYCDLANVAATCEPGETCQPYEPFGPSGSNTTGLCMRSCDPLEDNDFDGRGSELTRAGSHCLHATDGCFGFPSYGTTPTTFWACSPELHPGAALFHRVACGSTGDCVSHNTLLIDGCSQGYLPMLRESTMSSEVVCVAMCKPLNCYAGDCGSNNENRLGAAPHRCNAIDARGTFDTGSDGEHCQFLWVRELYNHQIGTFLRSPTSDMLGFCFDHSKYMYDRDGDGYPEMPLPPCASLADGFGSSNQPMDPNFWGAADLGCVDSRHANFSTGKPKTVLPFDDVRSLYGVSLRTP